MKSPSSGPIGFGLDEMAVDAVKHAQFRAGTLNGKPVSGGSEPPGDLPDLLKPHEADRSADAGGAEGDAEDTSVQCACTG